MSKSNTLNQNREFKELKATEWVKRAFSNPAYTPTTVIKLQYGECPFHHKGKNCSERDQCRHVFVIKRATVNKCGQVIFYVSSQDIVLPSNPSQELKRLKKIPCGSYHNARFDMDQTDTFSNQG